MAEEKRKEQITWQIDQLIKEINLSGNSISFYEDLIKGYSRQLEQTKYYKRELAKEQGLFDQLRIELKELEKSLKKILNRARKCSMYRYIDIS